MTMRSTASLLAVQPSRVRGSFIRKLTDDFIIPVTNLTLLVKIGEGNKYIMLVCMYVTACMCIIMYILLIMCVWIFRRVWSCIQS